jgi:vacuolar-type H+-ATPase subunit I/STV1
MKNYSRTMSTTKRSISLLIGTKFTIGLFLVAFLLGSFQVQSQNLETFKACSEKDYGPQVIPYGDLQGAANTLYGTQKSSTKVAEATKSATLIQEKKNNVAAHAKCKRNLKTAQDALSADDGTDASKTTELKKKVKLFDDKLEGIETEIKSLNTKIKSAIPKWEAVEDTRKRVMEVFKEAYDEVGDSQSHPERHIDEEPDSDKKEALVLWKKNLDYFKRYTSSIKVELKKGIEAHEDEKDKVTKLVKDLEDALNLK